MIKLKLNAIQVLLIGIVLTCSEWSEAQNEPPLPQGFGINELQTSENLSQGVININLPIESHLIPVSIGYTTSGIRVSQRAGVVGLGWQLQAGGYIVRQKRGLADDAYRFKSTFPYNENGGGYSGKHRRGQWVKNPPDRTHFDQLAGIELNEDGGHWDPEPDVYVFQFLGYNGRFTIDHELDGNGNRKVVMLTPSNLKIEPYYNTSTNEYSFFRITDEAGNTYLFNIRESTRRLEGSTEKEEYTSKWHLSKITQYATGDLVKFYYSQGPTHTENSTFRYQRKNGSTLTSSGSTTYTMEFKPKLLNEVIFKDSRIKFEYTNRDDVETLKKLDNIKYTLNGSVQLRYYFDYKYVGTGTGERLMLAGVRKSNLNVILYQFLYYGEMGDEAVLPSYYSSDIDHWGFYNNNTGSTKYPHIDANKSPYLAHAKANALKRVYYTAGGYEEYVYELNQYKNASNNEVNAGGLRVAQVIKSNGEGSSYITKSYNYDDPSDQKTSGELYAEPIYEKDYYDANQAAKEYREYSLEPLTDDMGRHIAYEYVTITHTDGGTERYKFHTFADDVIRLSTGTFDATAIIKYRNDPGDDDHDGYWAPASFTTSSWEGPFGNKNFKGTTVGLVKEKQLRDEQGNLLSEDTYEYWTKHAPNNLVMGMGFTPTGHYELNGKFFQEFKVSYYKLGYGYVLNDKITQTVYDKLNPGKSLTTVTDIYYHDDRPLETKRETYLLGNSTDKRIIETEYLADENPPSAAATEAVDNNMVSLVKKKTSKINTNTQGFSTNNYVINNTTSKLEFSEQKSFKSSYSSSSPVGHVTINYDSQGRLAGRTDEMSGVENCQILDEEGVRVMAEVSNATQDDCAFTSFEKDDKGGWSLPTLIYSSECYSVPYDCYADCDENNPTQTQSCYDACNTAQTNCLNSVNLTAGIIGNYAFELSDGSITKTLTSGEYILGYWMKSGTVDISGHSSNTLLQTRTLSGWTFEERKINMASTGTLTISGSAHIDHLRVHPSDAQMNTYTYHTVFGKTSETDANNNTIFYEYDASGRLSKVLDNNKSVIRENTYNIAQYLDLSETSYSPNYHGGTKDIIVTSNDPYWTVSDNASWVTVTPTSGSNNKKLEVTVEFNSTSSTRNATVTLGSTLPNKTITINQGAAPAHYLNVNPGQVYLTYDVSSNVNWEAISHGCFTVSPSAGSNDGSFIVDTSPCAGPGSGFVEVKDVAGNTAPRIISIDY